MTSADVVVLGAGPAGLTAAWRAAATGRSVVVLERAPVVGGMAGSFDVAGVRVDHGSHRLHPATPPHLLAALRGLLGEDLQQRPRNGRLRLYGGWVGFPLRAGELARAVPPAALARVARDAALAPVRRARRHGGDPSSYSDALSDSLGPELYETMYAPYAEKLWGLPGSSVDVEQARVRVTADTPWKVAARILRRQRGGGGHGDGQVLGRTFYYPRRGFGQIAQALADAAVACGADLRCGAEVVQVRPGGAGVGPVVRTADGSTVEAARVLSTLPLPLLARLSEPTPERALADASRLRFRAMVLVYLVHGGGRWSPYDAHYLPGRETPVTRVSEPVNYRDSADDPPDRTVLCAEIPCDASATDPVWSASDESLAGLVEEGLRRCGLPSVRRVAVEVRRLRHVYPVYERGFAAHLGGLEAWAGGLDGVTTFGRLGLFAHDNTHHAMVMAYDAVSALGTRARRPASPVPGWDAQGWQRSRERFRQHVVED